MMITSPSNQHIAMLHSLHSSKGREQTELFLIEGSHLLEAALDVHVTPSLIVFDPEDLGRSATGRRLLGRIEEARAGGAQVLEATPSVIERAADTRTPQGVVAAVASSDVDPAKIRARRRGRMRPLVLVLDAISDPGNLGTILRAALAADVDEVLLAPGSAQPLAPKVVRAASGATFYLPVRADQSWQQIAAALGGAPEVVQVLAAEASGRKAYDAFDLTQRTALIIGNEAHGLSNETKRLVTDRLSIPMWNRVESLNAAVATSVILFEAARQRRAHEAREKAERQRDAAE